MAKTVVIRNLREFRKLRAIERGLAKVGMALTDDMATQALKYLRSSREDRKDAIISDAIVQGILQPTPSSDDKRTEMIPVESDPHGTLVRGKWRGIPAHDGTLNAPIAGNARGMNREELGIMRETIQECYRSLGRHARKKVKRYVQR